MPKFSLTEKLRTATAERDHAEKLVTALEAKLASRDGAVLAEVWMQPPDVKRLASVSKHFPTHIPIKGCKTRGFTQRILILPGGER